MELNIFFFTFFSFPSFFFGCSTVQSGPNELTEQSLGVNYRALNDLFYLSEQRRDTFCYEITVQMIEIYNEQVRDLLASDGVTKRYPFLKLSLVFSIILSTSAVTELHIFSAVDASLITLTSKNIRDSE